MMSVLIKRTASYPAEMQLPKVWENRKIFESEIQKKKYIIQHLGNNYFSFLSQIREI